ncbi:MAG TPA: (d)CMP kinase [Terriglobia bacterium]|nr:(d)CMP kinase [Terriglobia bacterium]
MDVKKPLVIAIDGPAGAGKSTVARKLASRLGLHYVDSGATYRAAALKVLRDGVSVEDLPAVNSSVASARIELQPGNSALRVLLDGEDVTEPIRLPEVTLAAARISCLPEVRQKLIALQRGFLAPPGVVMDGRDIGTVVFPDAPLKIFLTAGSEERARRRLGDEKKRRQNTTLDQTAYEIGRRDQLDAERKISPLIPAADASTIDSSLLTADLVVEKILELVKERKLMEAAVNSG